jgi:hypothetical protein
MRRATSEGGFATILKRGDPDRGILTLQITERGEMKAVLERQMDEDFSYRWTDISSAGLLDEAAWRDFLAKKRRFDPDFWLIELDVADAQRFVAEMLASP